MLNHPIRPKPSHAEWCASGNTTEAFRKLEIPTEMMRDEDRCRDKRHGEVFVAAEKWYVSCMGGFLVDSCSPPIRSLQHLLDTQPASIALALDGYREDIFHVR